MSFDITRELQKTFDEAVMGHEAESLRTPEDWRKLVDIREAATDRISAETERYYDEYDTRVEIVRKRLINEAAEQKLDHPTPTIRDKFDGKAINRQAHREVELDHERVIMQIRDEEGHQLKNLQEEASRRDLPHGKAEHEFNQASDRRSGMERRAPVRSR